MALSVQQLLLSRPRRYGRGRLGHASEADPERYRESVERAADWICGMQSRNGGFASFDSDNTHYYLNEIPFADHGALLDPPTSDVSARCAAFWP